MLAVVYGCTKFHDYIYGMPKVEVESDHKPLKAIPRKLLHQTPLRLQKIIVTTQKNPLPPRQATCFSWYTISGIAKPGPTWALVQASAHLALASEMMMIAWWIYIHYSQWCHWTYHQLLWPTINISTYHVNSTLYKAIGWLSMAGHGLTGHKDCWHKRQQKYFWLIIFVCWHM